MKRALVALLLVAAAAGAVLYIDSIRPASRPQEPEPAPRPRPLQGTPTPAGVLTHTADLYHSRAQYSADFEMVTKVDSVPPIENVLCGTLDYRRGQSLDAAFGPEGSDPSKFHLDLSGPGSGDIPISPNRLDSLRAAGPLLTIVATILAADYSDPASLGLGAPEWDDPLPAGSVETASIRARLATGGIVTFEIEMSQFRIARIAIDSESADSGLRSRALLTLRERLPAEKKNK